MRAGHYLHLGMTCLVLAMTPSARAFTFVQQNVQPVYQFVIYADSGLIAESNDVTLDFEALGSVEITIDDADLVAYAMNPTLPIPIASAFGSFDGELPEGTVLPAGSPFTLRAYELVSGQLTNVTVDGLGVITGAEASFTLLFDKIIDLGDPGGELRLFGSEMTFTGAIDSVPFSVGTSFVSPDPVGLYLDDASPDGVEVGVVQNRFLNVVPEPGALGSLSGLFLGLLSMHRWRRRS